MDTTASWRQGWWREGSCACDGGLIGSRCPSGSATAYGWWPWA